MQIPGWQRCYPWYIKIGEGMLLGHWHVLLRYKFGLVHQWWLKLYAPHH
jgi:hypothetical protein